MDTLLQSLYHFNKSQINKQLQAIEKSLITEMGSLEKVQSHFKKQIAMEGELVAFLNITYPKKTSWSTNEIAGFDSLSHSQGLNDIIHILTNFIAGNTVRELSKSPEALMICESHFGSKATSDWLDSNSIALNTIHKDIGLSKNTLKELWLPFFFGQQTNDKKHLFFNRRKITPREYFLIWGAFAKVYPVADLPVDKINLLESIQKNLVVWKSDFKRIFNIRSVQLKSALEDVPLQKDYPKEWPTVIPNNADVFPYSVALFIARELVYQVA